MPASEVTYNAAITACERGREWQQAPRVPEALVGEFIRSGVLWVSVLDDLPFGMGLVRHVDFDLITPAS